MSSWERNALMVIGFPVFLVGMFFLGRAVGQQPEPTIAPSAEPTYSHPVCYRYAQLVQATNEYIAPGTTISRQEELHTEMSEWVIKVSQAADGTNLERDAQQLALSILTMDKLGRLERAEVIEHHCANGTVE